MEIDATNLPTEEEESLTVEEDTSQTINHIPHEFDTEAEHDVFRSMN